MIHKLLFDLRATEQKEANYITEVAAVKRRYCAADQSEEACSVNATCSPFAAKLLLHQLQLFRAGKYTVSEDNGIFTVAARDGLTHTVQGASCSCCFHRSLTLPCRHLFACSRHQQIPTNTGKNDRRISTFHSTGGAHCVFHCAIYFCKYCTHL